jgi:hypothetical protein
MKLEVGIQQELRYFLFRGKNNFRGLEDFGRVVGYLGIIIYVI